jgi:5,10-methylenetetrahydrofolate reductase
MLSLNPLSKLAREQNRAFCRTNTERTFVRDRDGATWPIETRGSRRRDPSLAQVILSDVSDASAIPHNTDDLDAGGRICRP